MGSEQRLIRPSPFQTRSTTTALGEFIRRPQDNRESLESMGYRADRWVCGQPVAPFQRDIGKWSVEQQQQFIASAWMGFDLGSLILVKESNNFSHLTFDGMVIDGQHRLESLEDYVNDCFPVFGLYWRELSAADRRAFQMATTIKVGHLDCHDEAMLRMFYDLLNYSGVAHEQSDRACAGMEKEAFDQLQEAMRK